MENILEEKELTYDDFLKLVKASKPTADFYSNEKNFIVGNVYTLFLSNGDRVKYAIDKNNIPHLLGFKNLNLEDKSDEKMFESFMKTINSPSYFERKVEKGIIKYSDIMSKYGLLKAKYIDKQTSSPYPSDILFMCKYNSNINFTKGVLDKYRDCEYYIGRKVSNGDIIVLGLTKNKYSTFSARTSRIFEKSPRQVEELRELLENQVVCYANGLHVDNNKTSYHYETNLYPEAKMQTLSSLKNLSNLTSCIVDVSDDYLYSLRNTTKISLTTSALKQELSNITSSVEKGEIYDQSNDTNDEDIGQYKEEIDRLVNVLNDKLLSTSISDENKVKYSKLKRDLEELNIKQKISESKISDLEEDNNNKINIINELKEELEETKKQLTSYKEVTSNIMSFVNNEVNKL